MESTKLTIKITHNDLGYNNFSIKDDNGNDLTKGDASKVITGCGCVFGDGIFVNSPKLDMNYGAHYFSIQTESFDFSNPAIVIHQLSQRIAQIADKVAEFKKQAWETEMTVTVPPYPVYPHSKVVESMEPDADLDDEDNDKDFEDEE